MTSPLVTLSPSSQIQMLTTIKGLYGPSNDFEARQKRFQEHSTSIVEELTKSFGNFSSTDSFREVIDGLAKRRRKIAEAEDTPDAEEFGAKFRDHMDDGTYPYTTFVGAYKKVAERIIQDLGIVLQNMDHTNDQFIQRKLTVQESVGDREFSTTFEYIPPEKVAAWSQDIPEQAYVEAYKNPEFVEQIKKLKDTNQSSDDVPQATKKSRDLYERFRLFKQMYPEYYQQGRMHFLLTYFAQTFPSPKLDPVQNAYCSANRQNLKSDFMFVTMRTKLPADGKMKWVATNHFLTCLYRNGTDDPVQRMVEVLPPVVNLHQDIYLHDISLDECEKVFREILSLDSSVSLDQLKEKIAFFRYLFSHAMPYKRGSAAIGEWIETALYQKFGYSCSYVPAFEKDSVDTIALASLSYSKYLERYEQLVNLEPLTY